MQSLLRFFKKQPEPLPSTDQLVAHYKAEATRGLSALLILSFLPSHNYGYDLRRALGSLGLDLDDGQLYPALHILEAQGLLRHTETMHSGPSTPLDPDPKPRRRFHYNLTPAGEEVCDRLILSIIHPLTSLLAPAEARMRTTLDEDWLRHYRDYPADAFKDPLLLAHLKTLSSSSRITVRDLLATVFPGAQSHADFFPAVWRLMAVGQVAYQPGQAGADSAEALVWLAPSPAEAAIG